MAGKYVRKQRGGGAPPREVRSWERKGKVDLYLFPPDSGAAVDDQTSWRCGTTSFGVAFADKLLRWACVDFFVLGRGWALGEKRGRRCHPLALWLRMPGWLSVSLPACRRRCASRNSLRATGVLLTSEDTNDWHRIRGHFTLGWVGPEATPSHPRTRFLLRFVFPGDATLGTTARSGRSFYGHTPPRSLRSLGPVS